MKKLLYGVFLIVFIFNQSISGIPVSFLYKLKIEPGIMHVNLEYTPILSDSTTFKYGNVFYGGMKDLLNSMVNIHSSAQFKIDSAGSRITFYYHEKTPVKISYDIVDTHKPEHKVVGEMFRPIITNDYFFSLSHTLFLTPDIDEKLNDRLLMSVTLQKKPAFPMYFSFAPEMKPGQTVTLKLSDGLDALITGATDLHIEKREMAGIKNYIVLRINKNNSYNLKRFMDYFDTFLPAMTNFWGNLNGSYYTLVASSFLDIKYHDISGTAFNSGFHVKFSGDTILVNETVLITISHEIMHRYIGTGCVAIDDNNQWFNEGFTDYTTWYLLSQCGDITADRFNQLVKETFEQLSVNPVRNTPNDEIMKHFWENHNYEKLPYNRGALFAAYIDKRITELSNGTATFRDFMRSLKTLAEEKKKLLTVDDFISTASKYIPEDEIRNSVQKYIIQGEMIPEKLIFNQ
ncbi:MAG: M1 family aminopeptidase [Bacteroidales bacterium]|nr:M1 family aminopeptidase [Bacteroidales bacterium]